MKMVSKTDKWNYFAEFKVLFAELQHHISAVSWKAIRFKGQTEWPRPCLLWRSCWHRRFSDVQRVPKYN